MSAEASSESRSPDSDSKKLPGTQTFQTVFRVSPQGQRKHEFHPRKAHKKSRAGCLTCKKRRVKCDEGKPECQRCNSRGIQCHYSTELELHPKTAVNKRTHSPLTAMFSTLSLEDITKSIEVILNAEQGWNPYPSRCRSSQDSLSTVAFHHFVKCSTDTIATPAIRDVMKTDMIRVAFTTPHLMYTILGVGMLHFNRCRPNKDRSFAESYFWQHAIKLYQEALSSNIREDNIDALLSTCMLMGIISVCPETFEIKDSWVLTNKPESMNWLALQSGLSCILTQSSSMLPKTIWAEAFKAVDKEGDKIFRQEEAKGREGLDPELADLCGIDEESTCHSNIYYEPLRFLAELTELEPSGPNAAHVTSFMGRLDCRLLTLLRRRDPPALILLAHWMGLMCLMAEWQPWVEARIRKECIAICMFLEHSTDPRVLSLLRFPAEACGYTLTYDFLTWSPIGSGESSI